MKKTYLILTLFFGIINWSFSQVQEKIKSDLNRGMELINQNKLEEALKEFQKIIELDSTGANGIAHNEIGYIYLKMKDSTNALLWLNKSIGINPRYPKPRINKAMTYITSRDLDNAIKSLDEFINELPGRPEAYYQRGNIYDYKGENKKAFRDYKTALYYNQKLNVLPKPLVKKLEEYQLKN